MNSNWTLITLSLIAPMITPVSVFAQTTGQKTEKKTEQKIVLMPMSKTMKTTKTSKGTDLNSRLMTPTNDGSSLRLLKPKQKKITFDLKKASGHEGASNVGGSDDMIQVVTDWSLNISDQLRSYDESAVRKYADGNMLLAVDLYRQGLQKVLESAAENPAERLSWTYKTAERALSLSDRLSAKSTSIDAQFDILQYFYQLVDQHYRDLDAPYSIRGTSRALDPVALDAKLRIYADDLLGWFQQKMIIPAQDGSVKPAYSNSAFLMTLATLSKGLSEDFGLQNQDDPMLFQTRYASVAKMLAHLSAQMENALAKPEDSSDRVNAVATANSTLKRIMQELN